jgi:hypothetical protein
MPAARGPESVSAADIGDPGGGLIEDHDWPVSEEDPKIYQLTPAVSPRPAETPGLDTRPPAGTGAFPHVKAQIRRSMRYTAAKPRCRSRNS